MKNPHLPDFAYMVHPEKPLQIVLICNGETGYHLAWARDNEASAKAWADHENAILGVTPEQVELMFAGSLFGWHTPLLEQPT